MKAKKLSPNFKVQSITETVNFYKASFGFDLNMAVPESQNGVHQVLEENVEYVYAIMSKDDVQFMFQRSDSFNQDISFAKDLGISASVAFYMEIEGIDEFYQLLRGHKLEITDLKTTWYGMKEFYVRDINGYILGFAEKVEQ